MHSRTAAGLALAASLSLLLAARTDAQEVRERVRLERRAPADSVARALAAAARNYSYVTMTRRARLGVTVDLTARDDDKYGATIDAVTPGGAAAKAGLRAGDVITALNGKPLTSGETPRTAEDGSSIPGLRLVELAAKLGGGDTVEVAYRRGGTARTARLITNTDDESTRVFTFAGPDAPPTPAIPLAPSRAMLRRPPMPPEMRGVSPDMIREIEVIKNGAGPARIVMGLRGGLGDLELAPINSDLGRYFGTTEGVLVLSTAKEEGLGLKGGDVVLAIDGRKVTSPAQLQRILRTYEPGETMKLELQRDRKRETISTSVPAPKKMSWTVDRLEKQDDDAK